MSCRVSCGFSPTLGRGVSGPDTPDLEEVQGMDESELVRRLRTAYVEGWLSRAEYRAVLRMVERLSEARAEHARMLRELLEGDGA